MYKNYKFQMKEYSTIELNNLARKDMIAKLKSKDLQKGLPRSKKFFGSADSSVDTTKNYLDNLRDLEEDPVGTPLPGLPDNNVIVVTTPAETTTT